MEPAAMTLTFATPDTVGGNYYIDLSQAASIVNRRFYRQGINWAVASIKVFSTSTGAVGWAKLPNTWVMSNAWRKAFEAWRSQQNKALEEGGAESMKAAFNDFKVYMDTDHVSASFAANLLPIDFSGTTATPGTWEPSKIVLPNVNPDGTGSNVEPAQRFLHVVGTNVNGALSRGIIEGYADSRSVPQSPDPVGPDIGDSDNWLARMFDVGSDMEEVLDNATLRNDTLPYNQDNYPGGQTQLAGLEYHDVAQLVSYSGANNVGTQTIKGGNFPCGLMKFTWTPEASGNLVVQVNLVPGHHRGYLCEPMTEM